MHGKTGAGDPFVPVGTAWPGTPSCRSIASRLDTLGGGIGGPFHARYNIA